MLADNTSALPEGSDSALLTRAGRQLLREPYPYYNFMLAMVVSWLDRASVLLGTTIAGSVEVSCFPSSVKSAVVFSGIVTVLVFGFLPKKRSLLAFPKIRRFKAQVRYFSVVVLLSFLVNVLIMSAFSDSFSECLELSSVWLGCCCCFLFIERLILTFILYQPAVVAKLQRKIAVVGVGSVAFHLAKRISCDAGHTYGLYGVFNASVGDGADGRFSGGLDDLIHRSRRDPLHAIILVCSDANSEDEFIKEAGLKLRPVLSDIYVMPSVNDSIDGSMPVEYLGPVALLVLQRRPLTDFQIFEKSVLDFFLAIFAIIFLTPLFVLVAVTIKLDSRGPVFFRQPRLGKNGREFMVYKFRSMHANMSDVMADRQTSRNDPRVTRIGKWLRKLSIDEIPQLFNVVQGDMSLVGPRPHAPHTRAGGQLLDDALAEYVLRYHVKPGITGWAQINGARGELVTLEDLKKRVTYDLEYIRRWSVFFDIKIMVLTVVREVFSRHAF